MNIYYYLVIAAAFFTAAAFAFLVTPAVRIFAFKIGALDIPKDDRRMHKEPIARLGGLSIFLGFAVSVFFFGATTTFLNASKPVLGILIGASIIIALGIIDDIKVLKAGVKFIVQIIAAAIPVFCGVRINIFAMFGFSSNNTITYIISVFITIFWIVGITNAVNLIDGLDGLAAGISSISTISVLIIMLLIRNVEIAIIAAALAGASLGFLPFNLNPARIFMGDSGATFLGFILAVLSIQGLFSSYLIVSFAVPFLVLAIPIFDTMYAIFRRISEKRSPMSADRSHIHHRLIDIGFSHKSTVKILYTVSTVLAACAIIITSMGRGKAFIFAVITFALILFAMYYLGNEGKHFNKHEVKKDEKD